jgi:hypothetical protein
MVKTMFSKYGHRVEFIRTDAATVENSEEVLSHLAKDGIVIKPAVPRNQRQNPTERKLQNIFNCVSAMLLDQVLLGPSFWDLALVAQANARNVSTLHDGISLYTRMTNMTPDINDYQYPFGTPVATFEQLPSDRKFQPKAQFGLQLEVLTMVIMGF